MVGHDSTVYTIGHSNHSLDQFVGLLRPHGVAAVADVRSTPYSRWCAHFNREPLAAALTSHGIAYVFLGAELGGRGVMGSSIDVNGRVQYKSVAESAAFREGLRRVCAGSQRMRLALMCTEGDPLECHRGILIARMLAGRGVPITHVHPDGRLETHHDAERRLLRISGLHEGDLFRTEGEVLEDAYGRQESRIAYTVPSVRA